MPFHIDRQKWKQLVSRSRIMNIRVLFSNMCEAMQQVRKVTSNTQCPIKMSWCYLSASTQDIVELATEVAQVYFDDRLPVHSLVLPNGNLEDTMNFIKWNMEERLVSFDFIREMNLLFRHGDTWGCYVIRDRRRYIYRAFI